MFLRVEAVGCSGVELSGFWLLRLGTASSVLVYMLMKSLQLRSSNSSDRSHWGGVLFLRV